MKEDVVNQMAHQKQLVLQDTKPRNEEKTSEVSKYRLITYPADFTVEPLVMKLKQGEIVIPTFQRRFVWTVSKASKLIESFLLGLPVPQIFASTYGSPLFINFFYQPDVSSFFLHFYIQHNYPGNYP